MGFALQNRLFYDSKQPLLKNNRFIVEKNN